MTAPAAETKVAASLALVLADVLGLGLPDPRYISVHPRYAHVSLQFDGPDEIAHVTAWADSFGVPLATNTDDPAKTWRSADFTRSGVEFHAYAVTETATG
jgi:hypothetical protein